MITIGIIQAIARVKDEITPKLGSIDKAIDSTGAKVKASGTTMQKWGGQSAVASGLAAAGITAAAVSFAGFESSMLRVQAVSGATKDQMAQMTDQAKLLGSTTEFSASQAADGMGYLAQAGFDANEVLAAMPGVLDLATAGQLGLAEASDIASNVLSGFGLEATEVSRAADVLAHTAASSNTNIQELGESFTYVAPTAKLTGQEMEDTAAAIGKLGDAGIKGSAAGTGLAAVLITLQKNSGASADELKRLGVNVFDASGNMRPLNDIMIDLQASGAGAAEMTKIFNTRALRTAAVLKDASAETAILSGELRNAEGAGKAMAEIMRGGLKGSFDSLKSATEGLFIAIGEKLAPALNTLMGIVTSVIRGFADLPGPVLAVVAVLGVLVAAIAPVLFIGGTMLSLLGTGWPIAMKAARVAMVFTSTAARAMWVAITGPVGLAVTAVALLVTAFVIFRKQIGNVLSSVIEFVLPWAERLVDILGWPAKMVANLFGQGGEVQDAIDSVKDKLGSINEATADWVDSWGEAEEATEDTTVAMVAATEAVGTTETAVAQLTVEQIANIKAAKEQAAAMVDLKDELLGLPTEETIAEMELLRATWDAMNEDERAAATGRYREALAKLASEGVALTAGEMVALVDEVERVEMGFKNVVPPVALFRNAIAAIPAAAAPIPGILERIGAAMKTAIVDNFKEAFSADFFAGLVNSIVTGATTLKDGLVALGNRAADWLGSSMAAGLAAVPVVGAFLSKLGPSIAAGLKAIGSRVWGWLGFGKSAAKKAAEEAARAAAERFKELMQEMWGDHETFLQAFGGSSTNMFDSVAKFAGQSFASARFQWDQYIDAVQAGNKELADGYREQFLEWKKFAERTMNAALSAFDRARQAGLDAYDQAYGDAVTAGQGIAQAARAAAAAQIEASNAVLAVEKDRYIRTIVFEQILAQIRAGNMTTLLQDAINTAANASKAWDLAVDAVRLAGIVADNALDSSVVQDEIDKIKVKWGEVTTETEGAGGSSADYAADTEAAANRAATAVNGITDALALMVDEINGISSAVGQAATDTSTSAGSMVSAWDGVQSAAGGVSSAIGGIGTAADRSTTAVHALADAIRDMPEVPVGGGGGAGGGDGGGGSGGGVAGAEAVVVGAEAAVREVEVAVVAASHRHHPQRHRVVVDTCWADGTLTMVIGCGRPRRYASCWTQDSTPLMSSCFTR